MVWWRRDPSLWCRSSLHRYVRRVARDNEAVLRSRSFSKSQPTSAQHKDDEDKKRPSGLSSLQWIQLQQYRRWKRRLQEDPYHTLFGASNDMLDGKGLKDWQWVYKAFPKWMIKEMDMFENQDQPKWEGSKRSEKDGSEPKPKNSPSNTRESVFPEPSFRSTRLGRAQYNSQIISPSDTRRPQEHNAPEITSTFAANSSPPNQDVVVRQETNSVPREVNAPGFTLQERLKTPDSATYQKNHLSQLGSEKVNQEAISRESTFIKEFLANSPNTDDKTKGTSNDWRQTVLDRRLTPRFSPRSHETTIPQAPLTDSFLFRGESGSVEPMKESSSQAQPHPPGERFWPAMASRGRFVSQAKSPPPIPSSQSPGNQETSSRRVQLVGLEKPLPRPENPKDGVKAINQQLDSQGRAPNVIHLDGPRSQVPIVQPTRTTPEVLRQLPEDDLDFLSADEIRGSMRAKKNDRESLEEKRKTRTDLETQYKNTYDDELQLHPMIASKIVNDQYMRRTVKELEAGQKADKTQAEASVMDAPSEVEEKQVNTESSSIPSPSIETSLDRMTRWLQDGGGVFAKHFWSEPTLARHTGLPSNQQHQAIVAGIRAGRTAIEHVEETIEKVVPSSKPLLARLKDNENSLIRSTRFMLGPRSTSDTDSEGFKGKSKIQNVRNVRNEYKKTEEEFEEACRALEELKDKNILNDSKQKLQKASLILQKNAKLARRIVFRVQSLEENPAAAQHAERFKAVKNRLSALQDTQVALLRLVERAIQLFGPISKSADVQMVANLKGLQGPIAVSIPGLSTCFEDPPATSQEEMTTSTLNTALNQKLDEEIAAQKSSMRGLSDDGYTRSPKPSIKPSFDQPSPLANSLFRPFRPLYESLGKEEVTSANNPESKSLKDEALVREIKKSYEDVYGRITVNHKQVEREEDIKQAEVADDQAKFPSVPGFNPERGTSESIQVSDTENSLEAVPEKTKDFLEEAKGTDMPTLPHSKESWFNRELNCQPEPTITDMEVHPSTPTGVQPQQTHEDLEPKELQQSSSEATLQSPEQPLATSPSKPKETAVVEEVPLVEATYKILTYDATTDELYITTTTSKSMDTENTTIPVHEALATLDAPAKFVPHISSNYEIVTSKPNLLVLRESATPREEILRSSVHNENEVRDEEWKRINPVDGTTRLSPTGFVGIEPDLRDEHDATRRKYYETWKAENERKEGRKEERQRTSKKGGTTASVFKTAILASAGCYIAGVIGELFR